MKESYVLFITQFLKHQSQGNQTGGTISNYILLKSLAKIRHVKVLTFDGNAPEESFANDGIEVYVKPPKPWRGLGLMANWVRFVKRETSAFIQQHGIPSDIVVTSSSLPALDIFRNTRKTKRWVIVQAYENFGLMPPKVPWQTRVSLAKRALVQHFSDGRLMREADGVITSSEYMRQTIANRFRLESTHINVLPQVCDMGPISSSCQAGGQTVGFVNRGADKNFPFVCELARSAPDLTFLIYGHTDGLSRDLPANIIIRGWVNDRTAMLKSAAVWLMPSAWPEPFGRVSIEAQAANRPVLVVNSGGLPETVDDARYIIDGFNVNAWLKSIRAALQLPQAVVEENGRKIREKFSQTIHDALLQAMFVRNENSLSK